MHKYPVELRDGGLWCGNVRVYANDAAMRLTEETREALGIHSRQYRILKCVECGRRYLGPHASNTCSDDCKRTRHKRHVEANNAEISDLRARARTWEGCRHCGGEMDPIRRCRYCSPKCRQAAYRERSKRRK